VAVFLEPVVDLNPQIPRGLHDCPHLIPVGGELQGELLDALHGVHEPGLVKQLAVPIQDGCLTHLFMDVYSHVFHGCHLWVACGRHAPMGSLGTSRVAALIRPSLGEGLMRTKRARGLRHPVHPHRFLRKRFSYPSGLSLIYSNFKNTFILTVGSRPPWPSSSQ